MKVWTTDNVKREWTKLGEEFEQKDKITLDDED